MNRRYAKALLSVVVLLISLTTFVYYFHRHPEIWQQLQRTPPLTLLLILALYSLFSGSIAMVLHASLKLCGATLSKSESAVVTIYSSVINFFGPLQSGPAFRAAYLKKKHGVSLKNYGAATLLYYAVYAVMNSALLFSTALGWWLVLGIILSAISLMILIRSKYGLRFKKLRLKEEPWHIYGSF